MKKSVADRSYKNDLEWKEDGNRGLDNLKEQLRRILRPSEVEIRRWVKNIYIVKIKMSQAWVK